MKDIKKKTIAGLIVEVAIITVMIFTGCIEEKSLAPESTTSLLEIKTPIWNVTDLEVEKLEKGTQIYVYTHIIEKRPPFYKGPLPLKFEVGYPPGSLPGDIYSDERPLFYDFEEFINYFIYYGTILAGAQTYDKEGRLLAEISDIRYFTTEEGEQGIEVEEIHYTEDKPIFKCKSLVDSYTGEKIKQAEEVGRKEKDYYFILPMR